MTDGRTDGGDCNIPDAFLKKRGDNKSLCLPKLKSIAVLLYDFSFKNENFATFTFVVKDMFIFNLRTFSQVFATVIKIF